MSQFIVKVSKIYYLGMQIIILLAFATAIAARPDGDFYDERYDSFNVEEVIENVRLLKSYVLCYLDKGKCTPEGNDFKRLIPEAIHSICGKCTEKQKSSIAIVLKAIIEKFPSDWEELVKKYNPKGEHSEQLNKFIKKYAPSEK